MKKYIQENKRVVVVLVAVPLIALGGFLFGLTYRGSTKDIVAVADQFQPDPSWKLESETINPPQIICIDSVCPQVVRSWRINYLTDQDILQIAKSYGGALKRDHECTPSAMGGLVAICSFESTVDMYNVRFSILQDKESQSSTMILQYVN
ncbi:MAG: hypothetical protein EOO17_03780 [Chloroflexi bacterium]|nr:MAG: hypothetical protein EOO17_03780 [Chloroflexota bacterium]